MQVVSSPADVSVQLLLVAGGGGGSSQRPATSPVESGGGLGPVGPGTSAPATNDLTPGHQSSASSPHRLIGSTYDHKNNKQVTQNIHFNSYTILTILSLWQIKYVCMYVIPNGKPHKRN